jgi:Ceramidase
MKRFGYFILIAWLGLTFAVIDTMNAPSAWTTWPPDYCRTVNCYCETIRDRLVSQPIATYSNLGFILAGLFIIVTCLRTPASTANLMTAHKGYALLFGAAIIGTGLFSFFYHASLTKVGDLFDLMGMFLFTSFIMLYCITRLRPMGGPAFITAYLIINILLGIGLLVAYGLQQVYFLTMIVGAVVAETLHVRRNKPQIQLRYMGLALLVFALGGSVWMLDGTSLLPCDLSAPFTWHGVWHLSAALAGTLMFLYFWSEGRDPVQNESQRMGSE